MRLHVDDCLRLEDAGASRLMRMVTASSAGRLSLVEVHEANVDKRNRTKQDGFAYTYKMASTLQTARARKVTVSPIGEVRDHGFKP
jgi:CRISPR-associated endonuclease Csn1